MKRRQTNVQPSISSGRDQRCRECGCMGRMACVDASLMPCHWVTADLCSHCADHVPAWKPGMAIYRGMWFPDGMSMICTRHTVDRSGPVPLVGQGITQAVIHRPELLTPPHDGIFDELGASLLADCLQNDAQAAELAPLFAQSFVDQIRGNWLLNEFQLRNWAAENAIPY